MSESYNNDRRAASAPFIVVFDVNETLIDIEAMGGLVREDLRRQEGSSRVVQPANPVLKCDYSSRVLRDLLQARIRHF